MNITRLNYIVASGKNIAFNIDADQDNMLYFGNYEGSSKFSKYYDYNMICLSSQQGMLYNMYSVNNVFLKSALYCKGKGNRTNTTYDFYPITNHKLSSQLTNMIQIEGTYYGLGDFTVQGKYKIKDDIYSFLSIDNGYCEYPPTNIIETILYDREYIHQQLNSQLSIDPDHVVLSALSNINYNQLFELPGNLFNDYQSTNMATNTFKTKNQYNSLYTMEHDDSSILAHARQYVAVDCCNNQLYLKYYDRVDYKDENSEPEYERRLNKFDFTYQHIEGIYSLNRLYNSEKHKSNLYSIAVRTNILRDMSEKLSANITAEIQNTTRLLAERLMPAHTQLFNVYVTST